MNFNKKLTYPLWMHVRTKQQAGKLLFARWKCGGDIEIGSTNEVRGGNMKK